MTPLEFGKRLKRRGAEESAEYREKRTQGSRDALEDALARDDAFQESGGR